MKNKDLYPKNWDSISFQIRKLRAKDKCECDGRCGLHEDKCGAINGLLHPVTGSTVVLTVAHLDQDPRHANPALLMAMCQRCHLTYDRNYYKNIPYAWIALLDDDNIMALLLSMENMLTQNLEHVGDGVRKAIDEMHYRLDVEFKKRIDGYYDGHVDWTSFVDDG